MKSAIFQALINTAVGMVASVPMCAGYAADVTPTTPAQATPPPAAGQTAPAKLPYGVEDVLKLSTAQVSENVILTYIQNSGTIYNLNPTDIVYLRDRGVSDTVITAMVDQRRNVTAAAAQATPTANPQPAPVYTDSYTVPAQPAYVQAPATYAQPAPTAVVVADSPPEPVSTLYVIPNPAARYAYYGRPSSYSVAPYYGGYYGGYGGNYRGYGGYYGAKYAAGYRYGHGGYYMGHSGWYGTHSGWHHH